MSDSFGARLRYERERRQIALQAIAENTKISIGLLEGLERNNVSRWPTGIFRKSFIRSYAQAIGLEPEAVAREFADLYPDPTDIVAPSTNTPQAAAMAIYTTPAPSQGHLEATSDAGPAEPSRVVKTMRMVAALPETVRHLPPVVIRFTIVSPGSTFTKGRFLNDVGKRWLAAACDAGVSCIIGLCLFAVLGRFWTPLGVSMLVYYVGGIVILGNTPGVCLFAPERPAQTVADSQ